MKTFVIFILSFFVCLSCFAQDIEKRYFENDPTLGGDVAIKSERIKVNNGEIYKTFEVESPADGAYYMDTWIVAPETKEGFAEYKVDINGILSEFSFKPQKHGWHSLALTDAKKSAATVKLKKGINTVSVIGKGPEVPHVEFIKLSSILSRTGISDNKYKAFVESIENGALKAENEADALHVVSSRGNNGIYDCYRDLPYSYTTSGTCYFNAGDHFDISAKYCVIELFSASNPESYSWNSGNTGNLNNLNGTIPATGYYYYLLRTLDNTVMTTMTINGNTYNNCVATYAIAVTVNPPGYNDIPSANYFTADVDVNNMGNTWLILYNYKTELKAYNRSGNTTSDGYSWGGKGASRITTNVQDIRWGMVIAQYSHDPYHKCDLYMGLASLNTSSMWTTYAGCPGCVKPLFPNLVADNSFLSAPGPGTNYNCIAWSVGSVTQPIEPSFFSTMKDWDDFYDNYGYTCVGATADNAAIALWGFPVNDTISDIRHASVRKNSVNPIPHGFEWESKLGARSMDRAMHTRDALVNTDWGVGYGTILYYYKPKNGIVNYSPPISSRTLQSSFSSSELNLITSLKNSIPTAVQSEFDTKYLAWEKTWDRPEIAIHSNPFMYARSVEYESLREYCMKYGKAIWPLVFDKLSQGDIYVISLLRDLTYTGTGNFGAEITRSASIKLPTLQTMQVDYCKGLLAKEEMNMLKSIHAIPGAETEPFVLDISANNNKEVLLNMYSEKDEKAVISIYNIFGHQEYKSNHHFRKGSQKVVIRHSKLKKGIYVVHVTVGDKTTSQTISF